MLNCFTTALNQLQQPAAIVTAAAIAALIPVVGWLGKTFLSWLVWYYAKTMREYERLSAIRAEISSNLRTESIFAQDQMYEALRAAYDEADHRGDIYKPIVIADTKNFVFDEIKKDLPLLPSSTINEIVDYYNYSVGLSIAILTLEKDTYLSRTLQQRKFTLDAIKLTATETCNRAKKALTAIDVATYWINILRGFILAASILLPLVATLRVERLFTSITQSACIRAELDQRNNRLTAHSSLLLSAPMTTSHPPPLPSGNEPSPAHGYDVVGYRGFEAASQHDNRTAPLPRRRQLQVLQWG